MTKMMNEAKRIMNETVTNFGFESEYTIEVAKAYETFTNYPNDETYFAFTMKAYEMIMQAYADMNEE